MGYCTPSEVITALANAMTSGNPSGPVIPITSIGKSITDTIPDSEMQQYIRWADDTIDAAVSSVYQIPLKRVNRGSFSLLQDAVVGDMTLLLNDATRFVVGDVVLIRRGTSSGNSGFSGWSGFSGCTFSTWSGHSGCSGINDCSAWSGWSGWSSSTGSGLSGFSGCSGFTGWSGLSGCTGWHGCWHGCECRHGWHGCWHGWHGSGSGSGSGSSFSQWPGFSGCSGFIPGWQWSSPAASQEITVASIINYNQLGLVSPLTANFPMAISKVERIRYPDPIPKICARLAAALVYDKHFAAQVEGNKSEYGKHLRQLAFQELNMVNSGAIKLMLPDANLYVGRRYQNHALDDITRTASEPAKQWLVEGQ